MSEVERENKNRWNFLIVPIILAIICLPFYTNITKCPDIDIERPKFIIFDGIRRPDLLQAVNRVLTRLGLEMKKINGTEPSEIGNDWNLLWTYKHQASYKDYIEWTKLKHHQKINHWPGNHLLVAKSAMATRNNFDFVPKAFLTSEDVQEYAARHPEKKFVLKLISNRGVKLMKASEMNFARPIRNDQYFAQEFIEDPLLWDGYKFDFSLFATLTAVDPMRIYYYNKHVGLRFCPKLYDSSNFTDVGSYVIADDHIAGMSFPYVKKYLDAGYTFRDAFEAFVIEKGGNIDDIWNQVERLIRNTVLTNEEPILDSIKKYKTSKYAFFELYRFDMLMDKNFKVYLIEVNMSPNILATSKKRYNNLLFENVLYNLFNLIGVGSFYEKTIFAFPDQEVESMIAYHDALTVKPEICTNTPCVDDCHDASCNFCWNCLHRNLKYEMIQIYNEQMNRGHFVRVFPVAKEKVIEKVWEDVSAKNKFFVEWFHEMCKKNKYFC